MTSAALYRWREAIERAIPLVFGPDDASTLDEQVALQAVADEILEAYLDALRSEMSAAQGCAAAGAGRSAAGVGSD